jgi:ABC-type cobalt transport system substrate-binding protein
MTISGITAILFTALIYVGSAVIGYFVVKNAIRDALNEYYDRGNKSEERSIR